MKHGKEMLFMVFDWMILENKHIEIYISLMKKSKEKKIRIKRTNSLKKN